MPIECIALARVLNPITPMDTYLHPPAIIQLTISDTNSPTLLSPIRGVNYTQGAKFSLITKTSVSSTSFGDPFLSLPIYIDLPLLVTSMVLSSGFSPDTPSVPPSSYLTVKTVSYSGLQPPCVPASSLDHHLFARDPSFLIVVSEDLFS